MKRNDFQQASGMNYSSPACGFVPLAGTGPICASENTDAIPGEWDEEEFERLD